MLRRFTAALVAFVLLIVSAFQVLSVFVFCSFQTFILVFSCFICFVILSVFLFFSASLWTLFVFCLFGLVSFLLALDFIFNLILVLFLFLFVLEHGSRGKRVRPCPGLYFFSFRYVIFPDYSSLLPERFKVSSVTLYSRQYLISFACFRFASIFLVEFLLLKFCPLCLSCIKAPKILFISAVPLPREWTFTFSFLGVQSSFTFHKQQYTAFTM
jgi:hypothetical protein